MREQNEGNINGNVIRDRLADHMRHGRNAAEAAGKERWLAEKQAKLGVPSRSSVDEIGDFVDERLVRLTQASGSADRSPPSSPATWLDPRPGRQPCQALDPPPRCTARHGTSERREERS